MPDFAYRYALAPSNYSGAMSGAAAGAPVALPLADELRLGWSERVDGADVWFKAMDTVEGSKWLVQDAYDHTNYVTYDQTGPPVSVDVGQYVAIPVVCTASGGTIVPGGSVVCVPQAPAAATGPPAGELPAARPTVDDVAELLRARTKDSSGNEVGIFDDATRPTGDEVERHIDSAMSLVWSRFPPSSTLADEKVSAIAELVAYRAAMRIEKSYFPEQVRSDRSPYDQLRQEYIDDLAAVEEAIAAGGGTGAEVTSSGMSSVPVGSWTSIPNSWIKDVP